MNFQGLIGIFAFIFIAYIFSENRKAIDWGLIAWSMCMQFIIAGTILGNTYVSLACFSLYIYAITTYNYSIIAPNHPKWSHYAVSLLITGLGAYAFSFLKTEALIVRNIIWNAFLIIGIIQVVGNGKFRIPLPKNWANAAGIALCVSILGTSIATNTTGADFFRGVGDGITGLLSFAKAGGTFLFGQLFTGAVGWIFAIDVSVSIIFFAVFVSIIDSLGLMNQVITSIARFVNWNMSSLGIKPMSGAEILVSIGSIPLGGNNLLFVKNYLDKLTNSEIVVMVAGVMATISASLFGAFISIGISANHLLAASAMSVPAVFVLSKILVPETEQPLTQGTDLEIIKGPDFGKPMSAVMSGISEGIQICLFMCGALIAFISLIALVDGGLAKMDAYIDGQLLSSIYHGEKTAFGEFKGLFPGSVKTFFGYIFSPLAYAMGTPKEDILKIGYLMGTKISINEFVAFTQLGEFIKNADIQKVSIIIGSFALCGYANPGTVAIVLGTVSPYVKEKKSVYAKYAFITMFLGAGASWMTAAVASLFASLL